MSNIDKGTARDRMIQRIKVSKLINRLQKFALSKLGDDDYDKIQMTPAQVQAAKVTLAKVLPDLKQVDQTIRDETSNSKDEIFAQLKSLGIDPEVIWKAISKH